MRRLTDQQVDRIARELAAKVGTGTSSVAMNPGGTREGPPGGAPPVAVTPRLGSGPGEGVYDTLDACVAAARTAFGSLGEATLSKRGEIIAAIRDAMRAGGDQLARLAWEETGLGRYEDKIIKNRLVTEKTPGTEALKPVATTGDDGLTLMEWAPFGVIGAITTDAASNVYLLDRQLAEVKVFSPDGDYLRTIGHEGEEMGFADLRGDLVVGEPAGEAEVFGEVVLGGDLKEFRLDDALAKHEIEWRWVKGHAGDPGN